MPSTTTALLVIDMQNDTVDAGGAYATSGAVEHAESQQVIAHVQALVEAARAASAPVFYSRIVVYPLAGASGSNAPIFQMLAPDTFKLGSRGAALVDGLEPRETEPVLDRTRMSVFNGTAIDSMLRNLGIESLVVAGAWTNMAVEHTVRDAADHGYAVTVVSDATSSLSAEWQAAALGFALTNIATISTTADVVDRLAS